MRDVPTAYLGNSLVAVPRQSVVARELHVAQWECVNLRGLWSVVCSLHYIHVSLDGETIVGGLVANDITAHLIAAASRMLGHVGCGSLLG